MSPPKNIKSLKEFCSEVDQESYLETGRNLASQDVRKSFRLLSIGLSLNPSKVEEYYQVYIKVIESWINQLSASHSYENIFRILDVAQDIYPQSCDLDYLLAYVLYRIGKDREAWQYSLKVLSGCCHDPRARNLTSALSNCLIDRWHFPMLNDRHRNRKYKKAIRKCVQRGCSSVLDIGAGSALLSIYAQRSGASATFACEMDEFLAEMAADVLDLNDSKSKVVLLNKHSCDIRIPDDLPDRVSLIVTETFDSGLFGEHILVNLQDAWRKLAFPTDPEQKRDADPAARNITQVLPSHVEIYIAILECEYLARQTKLIKSVGIFEDTGLHLNLNEPYLSEQVNYLPGKYKLLTQWEKVLEVDFNSISNIDQLLAGKLDQNLQFHLIEEGRADAFIMSYRLFLDKDISIDTFPDSGTCWENALYPIYSLSRLPKGSNVKVEMKCDEVLHFHVQEPSQSPSINTNDRQFLKGANSASFSNFYRETAENIFAGNLSKRFTVLDNCPFPQAGIALLELNPETALFVGNDNAFSILRERNARVQHADALKGTVDALFYWPFTPEGTLKENIIQELTSFRKLLSREGKVYPEFFDLHMIGIESPLLANMSRVDNSNACGVKVAEVFNLLKTQHHLDIAIDGIPYTPLTSILNPFRMDLNESKIIHNGNESSEAPSEGFLIVGGELSRSMISLKAVSGGKIDGFAYWFELSNSKSSSLESDTSPERDSDPGCGSTFGMKDLQDELPLQHKAQRREDPSFSSYSRDSPINQCVLLLDKPFAVHTDQHINLNVAVSGNHFSVHLSHPGSISCN